MTGRPASSRGATLVEYALMLSVIVVLVVASLGGFSSNVSSELADRGNGIGDPGDFDVGVTVTTTTPPATTVPATTIPATTTISPTATVSLSALAASAVIDGQKWVATVEITVVDDLGAVVAGATVEADWSENFASDVSCVTDGGGVCSMTQWNLNKNRASTTWSVTDIDLTGYTYDPGANVVDDIEVLNPF